VFPEKISDIDEVTNVIILVKVSDPSSVKL